MPDPAAQGHRAGGLTAGAGRASEPTLPELLRSAWRRAGPIGRGALFAIAVAFLAFAAWLLFARGGGSFSYSGPEAPPFSISWGGELEEAPTPQGQLLALTSSAGERLSIRSLQVPPGEGNALPRLALRAAERLPQGSRIVLEGRTKLAVDRGPEAYQVAYIAPAGDGIVIGKRFLVPDPNRPGEGVMIEIKETTSDPRVVEKVSEAPAGFFLNWPIQLLLEDAASVRTEEGLEKPLRSFAFG